MYDRLSQPVRRSACPNRHRRLLVHGGGRRGVGRRRGPHFADAAIRAVPAAARERRPPCPVGRFRCRISATARTTGSRAGIRRPRSRRPSRPTTSRSAESRGRRIPRRPDSRRRRRSSAIRLPDPTAVDNPPMSPRSQLATSGSRPIAACSAACSAPGIRSGSTPLSCNASGVIVHMTALVSRVRVGMSSSTKSITSPFSSRRRYPITVLLTDTGTSPMVTGPKRVSLARSGHRDVGELPGERRVAGILGVHESHAVLEIERVDHVRLALVQIHRARMDGRRRPADVGATQQPPGLGLQNRDLAARGTADVDRGMRIDAGAGEVAARPPAQQPVVDEGFGDGLGVPRAHLGVGQRQLRCRAEQLRAEHIRDCRDR